MKIINKDEVELEREKIVHEIKKGAIFIHPTDTIYGIGADATKKETVEKIRQIKERPNSKFSIIAPSKKWIYENCEINENHKQIIEEKLPGNYTVILNLKNKESIDEAVNLGDGTIGVRIPNHWIKELVAEVGKPIITTSANKHGENFMTKIEDLHPEIEKELHFAIHEGELKGNPSTIINLTKEKPEIIER